MQENERKYTRLLNDGMFKMIFGYEKNMKYTEWLLENLFNLEEGSLKNQLKILNSPKLPKIDYNGKGMEVDILIEMPDQKMINLEAYTNGFGKEKKKKSLAYITTFFGSQLTKKDKKYRKMKECIQINFIEDTAFASGTFLMMDISAREFVEGSIRIDAINIDKPNKSGYTVNENMNKLFRLMKARSIEEARNIVSGCKILEEMEEDMENFNQLDYLYETFNQKAVYERMMDDKIEETAELKLKEGLEQGRNTEKIETAKNLLKLKTLSKKDIASVTGLSIQKIEELKSN